MIEGGREGQTFQDMNDFFYYSMIRSKKENTTKTRKLGGQVPVDQLPNLMRAMGYYPTLQEIQNMQNEVRFSSYTESGQPNLSVNFETFIKLTFSAKKNTTTTNRQYRLCLPSILTESILVLSFKTSV